MRVTGIIAEYDPFHNGHRYQLKKAAEMTGADAVVIVMSGSFTQRGMPSFYDKAVRARAALRNGADLVIELPYLFSCNAGSEFARGGVGILDRLGVVTDLVFGSECDDLNMLSRIVRVTSETEGKEGAAFVRELKRLTGRGLPYPLAVCQAVSCVCGGEYAELLKKPNNVLGVEYLRSLSRLGSKIVPGCIGRKGADHGESGISPADEKNGEKSGGQDEEKFASASALRRILKEAGEDGGIGLIEAYLPEGSAQIFRGEPFFCDMQEMYRMLRCRLITSDPAELRSIYTVSEGIENRLKRAALSSESWEEFLDEAGTKRYTEARIRRTAAHILNGLTQKQYESLKDTFYARILGFSETGAKLLRRIRRTGRAEVISNLSAASHLDAKTAAALACESRATDLRNLMAKRPLLPFSDRRIIPSFFRDGTGS